MPEPGIPAAVTQAIIADGYVSISIFCGAFSHNDDMDDYIRDLLETRQLIGAVDPQKDPLSSNCWCY